MMKNKKVTFVTAVLICLLLYNAKAQKAITASGGDASGNGGTVSYTLGQITGNFNTGSNGSIVEGVQQPYEIFKITGFEETNDIKLSCVPYPNPTRGPLILKVGNRDTGSMSYGLYDINGILLDNKKLTGTVTSIDMENLAPAVYMLKVIDMDREVETYKIIKN